MNLFNIFLFASDVLHFKLKRRLHLLVDEGDSLYDINNDNNTNVLSLSIIASHQLSASYYSLTAAPAAGKL